MPRSYDQICPIAQTLDVVGDRWTILILRQLFFGDTKFSEFQKHLPGIPTRVLSERLKKLEEHAVIERRVYSQHPLRAGYALTPMGESIEPVLGAMAKWGMDNVLSPRERRLVEEAAPAPFAQYV
jgi:DNA-binding HxlR family transcriptional regulator